MPLIHLYRIILAQHKCFLFLTYLLNIEREQHRYDGVATQIGRSKRRAALLSGRTATRPTDRPVVAAANDIQSGH